jgi:DNA-directed RNA polymerase specialized sigma24 family protein
MDTQSFAELWNEYQDGDPEAKNRIAADFMRRIMGLLWKRLWNKAQAEDVAQSVFVSFVENHALEIAEIQKRDELWNLFAAISLRHCAKHNKRGTRDDKRGPTVQLGGEGNIEIVDPEPDPETRAALAELFARLNEMLTARQQEILGLHLAGRDRMKIHHHLGFAIPTIDRELRKIKEALAQIAAD